tara:strand:+ start:795 stop:1328 length:534 start_codon:yes stop_codon:yes gene_type:complete
MALNNRFTVNFLMTLASLLVAGGATGASLPGGASSLVETYEDWGVVCEMQANAPTCIVRQVQTNNETKQIVLTAEITRTPEGEFRGALVLPLGLSLAQGAQMKIDDADLGAARAFSTCVPQGCVVPLSFEAETIAKLRAGKALGVTVTPANQGSPVSFSVSLKGLTGALNRVADLTK